MEKQKIAADLIVADVLSRWAQIISVFVRHRMACVGCAMPLLKPWPRFPPFTNWT